jgi:uncharacterized protein YjiS (DUF1127 family)
MGIVLDARFDLLDFRDALLPDLGVSPSDMAT